VAMSSSLEEGLLRIDELKGLDHYYLFHAAKADLLRRMKKWEEAAECYRQALALATNLVEQDFLRRRLREIQNMAC
jgi:RNA polymerase sigma-70 factor (ECF subfamily)